MKTFFLKLSLLLSIVIDVNASTDLTAPVLKSLTFDTLVVDVSTGPKSVVATMEVEDESALKLSAGGTFILLVGPTGQSREALIYCDIMA